MTGHTTSLAEWAEMVSLAVGLYAAASVPYFLLVDADLDPRPLLRTAHEAAVHARHDLNWVAASAWHEARPAAVYAMAAARAAVHALAEFGRDTAALLILLTTSPKGAMA